MTTRFKICIIEDDAEDIQLLTDAFESIDTNIRLEITSFQSPLNFLKSLSIFTSNELPHLLIIDLKMPEFNGLEILKRLKNDKKLEHIRVITLTSSSSAQDIKDAYHHGADAYHVKPLEYEHLCEFACLVANYWGRFTVHAQ